MDHQKKEEIDAYNQTYPFSTRRLDHLSPSWPQINLEQAMGRVTRLSSHQYVDLKDIREPKIYNYKFLHHCMCGQDSKFKCSKCKKTYYCSQDCQRKDWSRHKHECK